MDIKPNMDIHDRISNLSSINSIWWYTHRIRLTYVAQGWLIVWDHEKNPPTRHDCREKSHEMACKTAVRKVQELTTKAIN